MVRLRAGTDRLFSIPKCPDRLRGPLSLLLKSFRRLFPGVKLLEREAGHSLQFCAEDKSGAIPPQHRIPLWRAHGQLYSYLSVFSYVKLFISVCQNVRFYTNKISLSSSYKPGPHFFLIEAAVALHVKSSWGLGFLLVSLSTKSLTICVLYFVH